MNLSPSKMVHKIWWLIYGWLGCFVVFQLFPFEKFEADGEKNALVDEHLQRNLIIRGPETEFYVINIPESLSCFFLLFNAMFPVAGEDFSEESEAQKQYKEEYEDEIFDTKWVQLSKMRSHSRKGTFSDYDEDEYKDGISDTASEYSEGTISRGSIASVANKGRDRENSVDAFLEEDEEEEGKDEEGQKALSLEWTRLTAIYIPAINRWRLTSRAFQLFQENLGYTFVVSCFFNVMFLVVWMYK